MVIVVAGGAVVSHTVYPFVPTVLLAKVHGNESSVWFSVSGFRYTVNAITPGHSQRLLSDILVMKVLWLWVCRTGLLHPLQQLSVGVGVGMG